MNGIFGSFIWLGVAGFAAALFFINPLADVAARFSHDVMIGSGALYGTLRIANSVMSVARDADITGGVGVASVTASPGQLLQPVINTIERMVDMLFYLAIVSGILSVVMVPVAKVGAIGLAAFALVSAGLTLFCHRVPMVIDKLGRAFAVLGVLGAVMLPASYTLAFYAGDAITDKAWVNATEIFERMNVEDQAEAVKRQVEALESEAPPANGGLRDMPMFDRLGSAFSGTLQAATDMADSVADNARIVNEGIAISSDLFTASIGIAVAYLVKLLVLPLMILAAFVYLLRASLR